MMLLKFLVGMFFTGMTIFFWTAWYLDREWRKIDIGQRAQIAKLQLENVGLRKRIRQYEPSDNEGWGTVTEMMWYTTKGDTQP